VYKRYLCADYVQANFADNGECFIIEEKY